MRSLEPLGEGDFCVAYRLNGHQVMRVPRHDEAARALRREACLLPTIAERLPVRVPVPTLVDGEPSCAVHDLIEGAALTRARWRALTEPVRVDLAHALGRFLRVLHALDVAPGHACGLPVVDHRAEVTRLRKQLREPTFTPAQPSDAALPATLSTDLVGCFDRYLAENASSAHPPALLHADVSPEHVLVDASPHERPQIRGIIDWGDACIGDPARDFIYLYEDWLYEDWGPALFDLALEAYEPGDPPSFRRRAYTLYLADQLAWTLRAADEHRARDVDAGVVALRRAVARLARYACRRGRSRTARPCADQSPRRGARRRRAVRRARGGTPVRPCASCLKRGRDRVTLERSVRNYPGPVRGHNGPFGCHALTRLPSRPAVHARVGRDPVVLPGLAAVVGERLDESPRVVVDLRDDEADEDRATRHRDLAEELPTPVTESPPHGFAHETESAVGRIQRPLARPGVVQAQAQHFELPFGPLDVELHQVGAPAPDLSHGRGALVFHPPRGVGQRVKQTLEMRMPCADLPVEVVLRILRERRRGPRPETDAPQQNTVEYGSEHVHDGLLVGWTNGLSGSGVCAAEKKVGSMSTVNKAPRGNDGTRARPNAVEGCPLTAMLAAVGGKWKLIIVYWLAESPKHFGALRELMPGISQKVLTEQLRELAADGLVHRKPTGAVPAPVEYSLTEHGRSVLPLVEAARTWGRSHLERTD